MLSQGLLLSFCFLPLLAIATFAIRRFLLSVNHEPLLAQLEASYFTALMAGCIFSLLKTCLVAFFTGIAKTRLVMAADILGLLLNVPLIYCLVFGYMGLPAMGIVGAALGTILSTVFSCVLLLMYYAERSNRQQFSLARSWVIDRGILSRYWRLGLPSGIEMFMNVSAFSAFLLLFQSYGVVQAASAAIVFNWDLMSFVPLMGLHVALISLVGRFVGAGDTDRLQQVVIAGFVLGLGYSGFLALLFLGFRESLAGFFLVPGSDTEAIHALASFMMLGMTSYVMADAVVLVAGGVLRGAGDTRWLMMTSIVVHWLMVLAQYLVIYVFELSPEKAWLIFVAMILVLAALYGGRLRGQSWRGRETLRRVMAESA